MIFWTKTKYFNDKGKQIGNSVLARKEIPIENIRSVEEVYNERVRLMKTKCMLICDQPIGSVVVEKSFDKVMKIIDEYRNDNYFFIKGYKRYDE
jgi:hypothetical protein